MKVWLINSYGSLPEEGWRETRFVMMARTFAEMGHEVNWWTSSFSHVLKAQRDCRPRTCGPNFGVNILKTPSYKGSVSLARIYFELCFAVRLYLRARREAAPDVIIAGHATQFAGLAAALLAHKLHAPLVVDIMDLWPEVFATALPKPLRWAAPALLRPLVALRGLILRRSVAVTGLSQRDVDVARHQTRLDPSRLAVIFEGLDCRLFAEVETLQPEDLAPLGLPSKRDGDVWAIYAGSLGRNYDIGTLLNAAELLRSETRLRIIIAGAGPRLSEVKSGISKLRLENVTMVGAVSPEKLLPLYRLCDIGLSLYSPDSTVAMPCKVYDYFGAGLAVVNSLKGEVGALLAQGPAGIPYDAGDSRSLAEALAQLVADPASRLKMSRRALQLARTFDRRIQYGRLVDLVQTVVAEERISA